jgi:hypothetical protein
MIIIPRNIVPPPLRKRHGRASSAKHGKRQNKQARQTRAIKRTRNEIRVILEDTRPVIAQVELREESRDRPAQQHASLRLVVRDVACILDELWEVDFVEGEFADFRDELGYCQLR